MNIGTIFQQFILVVSSISLLKQILYMFASPLQSLQAEKLTRLGNSLTKEKVQQYLKVSVIVPAYNEEVGIIPSIKSLLSNSYDNLEIVVVDDGSKDGTSTKVLLFEQNELPKINLNGKTFKFISKVNGGKGSALNTGIRASTGDIIITMDADTLFNKDAIYNITKYFLNPEVDAAVGNVKIATGKSILGILQQMEYTIGFYGKRTHAVFNSVYIIGGAFGAFRKKVFEKHGYFDEINKTEDIAMSTNLQKCGCKIVFAEDAIAYTEGPSDFKSLCKQRLRWKKGRFDVFAANSDMFFSTDKKHSKFLTFFLLPMSMFFEMALLLEPFLFVIVLADIIMNANWILLIGWLVFMTTMISTGYLFGSKENNYKALLLVPIFPFFSLVLTFAELFALIGSINLYLKRQDVVWQSWNRKGIGNV